MEGGVDNMYNNLKITLQKENISIKSFANFLGFSTKTAQNKLNGVTDFTFPEVEKIRKYLLSQYNPDFLFATDDRAS